MGKFTETIENINKIHNILKQKFRNNEFLPEYDGLLYTIDTGNIEHASYDGFLTVDIESLDGHERTYIDISLDEIEKLVDSEL
jgi:hypothetical protein